MVHGPSSMVGSPSSIIQTLGGCPMEIVWYGLSCFRLMERGMASVVVDPYDDSVGYGALRLKADIVCVSHDAPGHNFVEAVKGEKRIITGPGEFEIGGVFITGLS